MFRALIFSCFVVNAFTYAADSSYLTAQFGEADEHGGRILFIYSKSRLEDAQLRVGVGGNWKPMKRYATVDGMSSFGSMEALKVDKGAELVVRARIPGMILIVENLTIRNDGKIVTETKETGRVQLSLDEVTRGSRTIDPQTLAQARADYAARTHAPGILGSGIVETTKGTLAEGWGRGPGDQPSTAEGVGEALADATAKSDNGMTYRVRLYRGSTYHSHPRRNP